MCFCGFQTAFLGLCDPMTVSIRASCLDEPKRSVEEMKIAGERKSTTKGVVRVVEVVKRGWQARARASSASSSGRIWEQRSFSSPSGYNSNRLILTGSSFCSLLASSIPPSRVCRR